MKRQTIILQKSSNVAGKKPVAGQVLLGELALNTADVKLYASGTTDNDIVEIGWDRVSKTGDTMTGPLILPSISATTYHNLPLVEPKIPIVETDPINARNGQSWVLENKIAEEGTLIAFFGAGYLTSEEEDFDYKLSIQTPKGIKRANLV
jgi:hypothetical protein